MTVEPGGAPTIEPTRSPTRVADSHQPSPQARAPRVLHARANGSSRRSAAAGIAPSEWLIRYVVVARIGKRSRYSVSSDKRDDRLHLDCHAARKLGHADRAAGAEAELLAPELGDRVRVAVRDRGLVGEPRCGADEHERLHPAPDSVGGAERFGEDGAVRGGGGARGGRCLLDRDVGAHVALDALVAVAGDEREPGLNNDPLQARPAERRHDRQDDPQLSKPLLGRHGLTLTRGARVGDERFSLLLHFRPSSLTVAATGPGLPGPDLEHLPGRAGPAPEWCCRSVSAAASSRPALLPRAGRRRRRGTRPPGCVPYVRP